MTDEPQPEWRAQTEKTQNWPYSPKVYVLRVIWAVVHATIWKVAWKRFRWMRSAMVGAMGGKLKSLTVNFAGSSWIEMPWDAEFGDEVAIGPRVHLYNLGGVSIGSNTVLSQDVYVCGGTHDYTDPTYPLLRKKIWIGHSVWIGAGAFIGPGVRVGDGAVVGARAVVVKDVDPWTVVAGNPAKFIKRRQMKPAAPPASEVVA